MPGKLKIREIAAHTGLSISTVSRVLAGKANTSVVAKEKVMEAARSNGVLNDMSVGRLLFNTVMVFAPPRAFDVRADIFYYRVVQEIRATVAPHDVRLTYCSMEENNSDSSLFLKKITDRSIDAAIIVGIDDPHIHELAADSGKPCVLVNSKDKSMRLDVVSPNHRMIGEYAATYLIGQGHRNILSLLCLRRSTMEDRLLGIREAYAANNMAFDEQRHLAATSGFGSKEAGETVAACLKGLAREDFPSAILANGDFMAVGAIQALDAAGLRVPTDVSVMSMDGANLAELHDVQLTSLCSPRDELGREAIRLLQQRITHPDAPIYNLQLNGWLAARDSVKRIPVAGQKTGIARRDYPLYGG